jgi:hypothetical protein
MKKQLLISAIAATMGKASMADLSILGKVLLYDDKDRLYEDKDSVSGTTDGVKLWSLL